MPLKIAVIAEADGDRKQVCELVDRKILHHSDPRITARELPTKRIWSGIDASTAFTRWTELKRIARSSHGLRRSGYIGFRGGRSQPYDFVAVRNALALCELADPRPDAVLLIRDLDHQSFDRRRSIQAAVDKMSSLQTEVFLALPLPKREAWVLNGFIPTTRTETTELRELRGRLSFDPCAEAQRLDARTIGSKRDAKAALRFLTKGNAQRESQCWLKTDWRILRRHGVGSGLTDFLEEIKNRLIPLVQ